MVVMSRVCNIVQPERSETDRVLSGVTVQPEGSQADSVLSGVTVQWPGRTVVKQHVFCRGKSAVSIISL